jgi:uncharacterized protein (TIGR02452 family)
MFPRPEHDRLTVWNQTKELYKEFPPQSSTLYIEFSEQDRQKLQRPYSTLVTVERGDCIEIALSLKRQGYKPLLLNMADWFRAGGMVDFGSGAQEEECFRRSNYFKHLHQSYYPLKRYDTLLSKNVEYYCGPMASGYLYMDKPETLDMIAAPAVQSPWVTKDGQRFQNMEDIETMEQKLRLLFWIGAKEGNDVLVLSAWGCGAFGCPPRHVAEICKKISQEQTGLFKKVVFAIIGHNFLSNNYTVFQEVFEGQTA